MTDMTTEKVGRWISLILCYRRPIFPIQDILDNVKMHPVLGL